MTFKLSKIGVSRQQSKSAALISGRIINAAEAEFITVQDVSIHNVTVTFNVHAQDTVCQDSKQKIDIVMLYHMRLS